MIMAIRPEALPTDAAALAEMVLALDAENEKLRVAMQTLKEMIFGKRSERLAVIVCEQLALELDIVLGPGQRQVPEPPYARKDGHCMPERTTARSSLNMGILVYRQRGQGLKLLVTRSPRRKIRSRPPAASPPKSPIRRPRSCSSLLVSRHEHAVRLLLRTISRSTAP